MKYLNGTEALVGDKVTVDGYGHINGHIVAVIDTNQYSDKYTEEGWSYLKKGVLVEAREFGLVYYEMPDEDLKLVERANDK